MKQDESNEQVTVRKCRNCDHWTDKEYGGEGQHVCKGIEDGKGFSNEGCSSDFIYCTAPDFFCANFKLSDRIIYFPLLTR